MRHLLATAVLFAVTLAITACTAPTNEVARGNVVGLGQENLVLDDGSAVLFLNITPDDHARLENLKKGDKVILYGEMSPSSGGQSASHYADIDELGLSDGTRVPLGQQ